MFDIIVDRLGASETARCWEIRSADDEGVCLLPVQDFITPVKDVRLGVMVGANQLVGKGLKGSNFLLL